MYILALLHLGLKKILLTRIFLTIIIPYNYVMTLGTASCSLSHQSEIIICYYELFFFNVGIIRHWSNVI